MIVTVRRVNGAPTADVTREPMSVDEVTTIEAVRALLTAIDMMLTGDTKRRWRDVSRNR